MASSTCAQPSASQPSPARCLQATAHPTPGTFAGGGAVGARAPGSTSGGRAAYKSWSAGTLQAGRLRSELPCLQPVVAVVGVAVGGGGRAPSAQPSQVMEV